MDEAYQKYIAAEAALADAILRSVDSRKGDGIYRFSRSPTLPAYNLDLYLRTCLRIIRGSELRRVS